MFYIISMLQILDKPGFLQLPENHRIRVIPLNLNPEDDVFLVYSADDPYLISPLQLEGSNDQFVVKNLITNYEQHMEITSVDTNSVFEWIRSREFTNNWRSMLLTGELLKSTKIDLYSFYIVTAFSRTTTHAIKKCVILHRPNGRQSRHAQKALQ